MGSCGPYFFYQECGLYRILCFCLMIVNIMRPSIFQNYIVFHVSSDYPSQPFFIRPTHTTFIILKFFHMRRVYGFWLYWLFIIVDNWFIPFLLIIYIQILYILWIPHFLNISFSHIWRRWRLHIFHLYIFSSLVLSLSLISALTPSLTSFILLMSQAYHSMYQMITLMQGSWTKSYYPWFNTYNYEIPVVLKKQLSLFFQIELFNISHTCSL